MSVNWPIGQTLFKKTKNKLYISLLQVIFTPCDTDAIVNHCLLERFLELLNLLYDPVFASVCASLKYSRPMLGAFLCNAVCISQWISRAV